MFGANPVRQLIVPAGVFYAVSGDGGALEVRNNYGAWPASPVDLPLDDDRLWVRLQLGAKQGDALTAASWHVPKPLLRSSPGEVLDSYYDSLASWRVKIVKVHASLNTRHVQPQSREGLPHSIACESRLVASDEE